MSADPDIMLEATDKGGRYVARMPDGDLALLTFVHAGQGRIIADRTFVPPPWRGEGIGEALALRLFRDAREKGLSIVPTCWFVADELSRLAPEWDDVRAR